jgi:hypothetical protein
MLQSEAGTAKQAPKRKVDVKRAYLLHKQGASYRDIAKVMDTSAAAVFRALRVFSTNPEVMAVREQAAEQLGEICELKALECVAAVNAEKIKGSSARDLIVSAGILIDKMRLIRGQSTGNLAVSILSGIPDPRVATVKHAANDLDNSPELQAD